MKDGDVQDPGVDPESDSREDSPPPQEYYGLPSGFESVYDTEYPYEVRVGRDSVCILNGSRLTLVDQSGDSDIRLENEPVDFAVGDIPFVIDDDEIHRLSRNGVVTHTSGDELQNVAALATMLDESLLAALTSDSNLHFLETDTLIQHDVISFPTTPDDTLLFEGGINSIAVAKGSRAVWYYQKDYNEIGNFVIEFDNAVEGIAQLTDSILFLVDNHIHVYDLWTGNHVRTIDAPESLPISGRGRDYIWSIGGSESTTSLYSVSRKEVINESECAPAVKIKQTPVGRCVSIENESQLSVFTRPDTIECTLGSDSIQPRDSLTVSISSCYESKEYLNIEIWGSGVSRESNDPQTSSEVTEEELAAQISNTTLRETAGNDMLNPDLNLLSSGTVSIDPGGTHDWTLDTLTITSDSPEGAIYVVADGEIQSEESLDLEGVVGELNVGVNSSEIRGNTATCNLTLENTGNSDISDLDYSGCGEGALPETIAVGDKIQVEWKVPTKSLLGAEDTTARPEITYYNGSEFAKATIQSRILSRPPVSVEAHLSQTSQSLILELVNESAFKIYDQLTVMGSAITDLSTGFQPDIEYELTPNERTKVVLPLLSAFEEILLSTEDTVESTGGQNVISLSSSNGLLKPCSQLIEIQQPLNVDRSVGRWNPVTKKRESIAENDLQVGDILIEAIHFDISEQELLGKINIWDRCLRFNTDEIHENITTDSLPEVTISSANLPDTRYRYHKIMERSAAIPEIKAGYRSPDEGSLDRHRFTCSDSGVHINAILRTAKSSTALHLKIHNNTAEKVIFRSLDLWSDSAWETLTTERVEVKEHTSSTAKITDLPQTLVEELQDIGNVQLIKPDASNLSELDSEIFPITPLVYQDGPSKISVSLQETESGENEARLEVSNTGSKPLQDLTLSVDSSGSEFTRSIGDLSVGEVWTGPVSTFESLDETLTIHGVYDGDFVDFVFEIDSSAEEKLIRDTEAGPVLTDAYCCPRNIRSSELRKESQPY